MGEILCLAILSSIVRLFAVQIEGAIAGIETIRTLYIDLVEFTISIFVETFKRFLGLD
jgi:hypothetical protein